MELDSKAALQAALQKRAEERGWALDRACRDDWERILGQDLTAVRVHPGNDRLLDALGAQGACWRNHLFLRSGFRRSTLAHEVVHAAQWMKFGNREVRPGIALPDDPCEREADRVACHLLNSTAGEAIALKQPCSAELLLDSSSSRLIVEVKITGHASPRWKGARSDDQRVNKNDHLSVDRADAAKRQLVSDLTKKLRGYSLDFRYDVSYDNDSAIPGGTAVVGSVGRGQRDSITAANGDKSNDDQKYRRADVAVRIAREVREQIPTRVRKKWGHSTRTRSWYANVGFGASVYVGGGATYLRIKLTNLWNQTAEGNVIAFGGGVGLVEKPFSAGVTWSDDTSVYSDEEVGFEDFHGTGVRYTSATIGLFGGYNWSYITFYGKGPGAASRPVGGWSLGGDIGASASINTGVLWLDTVPDDYTIDTIDATEWETIKSDWTTQHALSIYFPDEKAGIVADERIKIDRFADEVAHDILSI